MKADRLRGALLAGIGILALANSCGRSQEDEASLAYPTLPGRTEVRGDKNFANLINGYAEGRPKKAPWAGFWWPFTANGIAAGSRGGSPAGKYDAARGDRSSNAQGWETAHHGSGVHGIQGWWGHCNGWSAAAVLVEEPREPRTVNGVEFSVGDQKALLSEAAQAVTADFYGDRTDPWTSPTSGAWDDTVPNQFFLVLTNYMGILKMGILFDRNTLTEIWNQPMAGYRFRYPTKEDYLGADSAAPGIYRINMTATIWWAEDGVPPDVLTPPFEFKADGFHFNERELQMELWLDGPVEFGPDGKIVRSGNLVVTRKPGDPAHMVGGAWKMGTTSEGWPDYMWIPYSIQNLRDIPNLDKQDFVNIFIDFDWLKKYMLTGRDDPSATPLPVPTAPSPSERPSSTPSPEPTWSPTTEPEPSPIPEPEPIPIPTPTWTPTPTPTGSVSPARTGP